MTMRGARFKTGSGECIPLGSKIGIDELLFTVGGSAANTAVTFARRGFKAAAIAKVGGDIRGEEIIRVLSGEGVDTRFMSRDAKRMTAYSIILIAPSGERSILTYRGAEQGLRAADVPLRTIHAKWFYVTHLSGISAALFPKILHHAYKIGARVAVNPGKTQLTMPPSKLKALLNFIDVFIVNREEASYLTKIPYRKQDAIFRKLDAWVRGFVVMTDGPKGVTVSDGKTRWHAGVLKERRVADRTGAGDAFGSGFVAGLIEQRGSIPYAIQLGSANATSAIERIGAQEGILRKRDSITQRGELRCKVVAIRGH